MLSYDLTTIDRISLDDLIEMPLPDLQKLGGHSMDFNNLKPIRFSYSPIKSTIKKDFKMLAIDVLNYKGGVGKSTISVNLAGYFAAAGKKVAVLDLDKQASCHTYQEYAIKNGTARFDVVSEIKEQYDVVIVDHPPQIETKPLSNFIIVPTTLDMQSLASSLQTKREFPEEYFVSMFANKVEMGVADHLQMLNHPMFDSRPYLTKRIAYQACFNNGMSVFETESKRKPFNINKAKEEFEKLVEYIMSEYLEFTKKKSTIKQ